MIERAIISGIIVLVFLILWFAFRQIHMRRASHVLAAVPSEPSHPSVLYFRSDNCAPCIIQERHLHSLEESSGVRIRRINTDYDPDIADRYGVFTLPTTLIVDDEGVVRYANYGVTNLTRLTQQLERLQ